MFLAAFAFVLTLTVILGAYWVFEVRPEQARRARLLNRLGGIPVERIEHPVLVKALPGSSQDAGRFRAYRVRAARSLRAAGVHDGSRFLARTGGAAIAVAAVSVVAGAPPLGVMALAIATAVAPLAWLRHRMQQRLNALEEMLPQGIDLLVRALRAGHAFSSAAAMVAEELPDPIASEFRTMHEQQNFGMPVPDVLREFAERAPLQDVRFFVTAVLIQRETGGNLSQVLENLATVTRDRFRVRRQLQVMTAQGRMTGWILSVFPLLLAVFLVFWAPSHAALLVNDPLGNRLLMGAATLQLIGIFTIRRIVRVEY
jgi:tight adherence protein B